MSNKDFESSFVGRYVKSKIKDINISISNLSDIPAFYMIRSNQLEGWCWQSSIFLSINFKKTDSVVRGYLELENDSDYFHSWIEFKLINKVYVFDPCFGEILKKEEYYQEYKVKEEVKISVGQIKRALIDLKFENRKIDNSVRGSNNVKDVFFRISSKFTARINIFNKIKRLSVRYYCNEG